MTDNNNELIFTTKRGVKIYVAPGKKSQYDFRVRYREPGRRTRTPKHIHWVIDLVIKREHDSDLTNELLDFLIDVVNKVNPSTEYPPKLKFFSKVDTSRFDPLDRYGEYSSDFLLVTIELIMIQEKTNYPKVTLNLKMLEAFRKGVDIFDLVSRATFR